MLPAEVEIYALAATQGGVVTAAQARELGMGRSCILRRVREGRWESLGRALLFVDPRADRFWARCFAAVLATSHDAPVLSHVTAARLHGMQGLPWPRPDGPIHLSFARERGRAQRPGLRLHWSSIPADQVISLDESQATRNRHDSSRAAAPPLPVTTSKGLWSTSPSARIGLLLSRRRNGLSGKASTSVTSVR
jgi:hypothetical protein